MSHPAASPGDDPIADRYGRRTPTRPGRAWILAALGVLLLVAAVVVVYRWSRSASHGIDSGTVSYTVVSDSRVDVRFEVHKPSSVVAVCRVIAEDRYTDIVGTTDVTIPAGKTVTQLTVTITTVRRAILGEVDSCGPAR